MWQIKSKDCGIKNPNIVLLDFVMSSIFSAQLDSPKNLMTQQDHRKSRTGYVIRCGLFQQSPSICSEPVPVGFSQKLAVLVLEGEVGGDVAVDVVCLDVVVDDGHLAGEDGGLEGV